MGMVGGILTREMHDNQGFEGRKTIVSFCTDILLSFFLSALR
jgi:hypothetical protein